MALRGLMGYEGHVMHMDPEEKERETAAADVLPEARPGQSEAQRPAAAERCAASTNRAACQPASNAVRTGSPPLIASTNCS